MYTSFLKSFFVFVAILSFTLSLGNIKTNAQEYIDLFPSFEDNSTYLSQLPPQPLPFPIQCPPSCPDICPHNPDKCPKDPEPKTSMVYDYINSPFEISAGTQPDCSVVSCPQRGCPSGSFYDEATDSCLVITKKSVSYVNDDKTVALRHYCYDIKGKPIYCDDEACTDNCSIVSVGYAPDQSNSNIAFNSDTETSSDWYNQTFSSWLM
jgi:hypothetical protein